MIRMAIAIGFGGVLLLGSYWVLQDKGILTVGELVLFSMLIQRMLWPLTRMGITLDEFERAKASARARAKSISFDHGAGSGSGCNTNAESGVAERGRQVPRPFARAV